MKRVAIYARVSTGEQTVQNQLRELQQRAEREGWQIVEVFTDEGISGKHGRDKRPAFDKLMRSIARRDFDTVAVWSVDRLSRSLPHLLEFMMECHSQGVDLYFHQQGIDTSTPSGKAMFQMMGVFAEFERAMIQERVRAGLQRARSEGKVIGRPKVSDDFIPAVLALRDRGYGIGRIATELQIGNGTVQRILKERTA